MVAGLTFILLVAITLVFKLFEINAVMCLLLGLAFLTLYIVCGTLYFRHKSSKIKSKLLRDKKLGLFLTDNNLFLDVRSESNKIQVLNPSGFIVSEHGISSPSSTILTDIANTVNTDSYRFIGSKHVDISFFEPEISLQDGVLICNERILLLLKDSTNTNLKNVVDLLLKILDTNSFNQLRVTDTFTNPLEYKSISLDGSSFSVLITEDLPATKVVISAFNNNTCSVETNSDTLDRISNILNTSAS